jgi:dolichol kinase
LTVGVGDTLAAVIGIRFGHNKWGAEGRKSIEGSAEMFIGQVRVILTNKINLF